MLHLIQAPVKHEAEPNISLKVTGLSVDTISVL